MLVTGAQIVGSTVLVGTAGVMYFAKNDIKQVNKAANEVGVVRNEFGNYIHQIKDEYGMKASDNFKYKRLLELASELLKLTGR